MIKCSNCSRLLEDTYQEELICPYCGKRTNREEALATSEEEVRRKMIWDISDDIQKFKAARTVGFTIGPILLAVAFVMLFSNLFTLYIMILFAVTLALGFVWLGIGFSFNKKSEDTMNRMFDLSSELADTED